jgi:hypothetical protein
MSNRSSKQYSSRSNRYRSIQNLIRSGLTALPALALSVGAAEQTTTNAPLIESTNTIASAESTSGPAEKPAPLPLHQIEGNGGIFSTLSAYLVNPPRNGELVGRPSVGFAYVDIGHGRNLEAFTITESPWKRLELGYAYDRLALADLGQDVERATGIRLRNNEVQLHNFNARLNLVKEGDFDQKWVPAVTFGTHYKYNDGIQQISDDLKPALGPGGLQAQGIRGDSGTDFTLYASKMLTFLPRPVLLNVGGRATEGAHIGLLGFTSGYEFVAEANVAVFVTDRLALAAEYRQKPNNYKPIGNLVAREDDWWTIDAAYVVNKHLTLAAGYGHFGQVLNHEANGVWGLTTKWEF